MDIRILDSNTIEVNGHTLAIGGVSYGPANTAQSAFDTMEFHNVVNPKKELDPAIYANGHNGLTIEESVNRVAYLIDQPNMEDDSYLRDGIERIIRNGDGRDACYRLAGKIGSLARQGWFKGIPLSYVFYSLAHNHISLPADA